MQVVVLRITILIFILRTTTCIADGRITVFKWIFEAPFKAPIWPAPTPTPMLTLVGAIHFWGAISSDTPLAAVRRVIRSTPKKDKI